MVDPTFGKSSSLSFLSMSSKNKYIGISNRIPFVVLEHAVGNFLKTSIVNSEDYLNYIKEFTKGENRAKKTLGEVVSILTKNQKLLDHISKKIQGDFNSLQKKDRYIILLCLHSLTFPITYDILTAFATGFKVQELISKRVIVEKISSIYGSNRAMHIGLEETIPFLIHLGIIEREKIGIYKKAPEKLIPSNLAVEVLIYTDIKLSGSKSLLINEIGFKPWFSYFEMKGIADQTFKFLITKKESLVGNGYLTVQN
jgi:hypothetical protein